MVIAKQLTVAIDFHSSPAPHTMEVNGYRQLFGYHNCSKYLLLCSTEEIQKNRKKFKHVGNNKRWVNVDSVKEFTLLHCLIFYFEFQL